METRFTTLFYLHHEIPVYLIRKPIKNAYSRYKNGAIYVTSNYSYTEKKLLELAKLTLDKLIKKKVFDRINPITEETYYLFGHPILRNELSDKKLESLLRKELRGYLEVRVREFEKMMSITEPYKIKVQKMKTRYATNSLKTHTLTFALSMVHYQKEIIDGLIVHELAHHYRRDHSKFFYNIVLRYYPSYRKYDKQLKGGIFHE